MEYVLIKQTCEGLEESGNVVDVMLSDGWVLYGHPFLAGTKHIVPGQEVPEPIICQAMIREKTKKARKS